MQNAARGKIYGAEVELHADLGPSWFANFGATYTHGRYESFVLDVVRAVDARWRTVPDRAHRVLAGNSEGAYAAANLALRHPATFGAFEGWSGYYRQTRTGVFKHASAARLRANSPIDLARARSAELVGLS